MSAARPRRIRGKLAAWSLAIAGVAAIAVAAAAGYPALLERWYGIPVVRTWRELLEQEPIDLGDGMTVRLGIEAKQAPLWSGVLVYCLAEGYAGGGSACDDVLGPLELTVLEEGDPVTSTAPVDRYLHRDSSRTRSPRLFAQAISVTSSRDRRIELRLGTGEVLRATTVRADTQPFHPWMPLERSTSSLQRFVNGSNGIAVPRCEGWRPMRSALQAGLRSPETELPTLLPRSEEPTGTLRDHGSKLLIRAADIELTTWAPAEHLLARFWINGRPFLPQPMPSVAPAGGPRLHPGLLDRTSATWLFLAFELDVARLGARPGDRVDLQLLYVNDGWEPVAPTRKLERSSQLGGEHRPVLTNRIELTAP